MEVMAVQPAKKNWSFLECTLKSGALNFYDKQKTNLFQLKLFKLDILPLSLYQALPVVLLFAEIRDGKIGIHLPSEIVILCVCVCDCGPAIAARPGVFS